MTTVVVLEQIYNPLQMNAIKSSRWQIPINIFKKHNLFLKHNLYKNIVKEFELFDWFN